MILERIEVLGFRGVKRLSLNIDQITVLIGENAWGKSSLLDAFTVALSPEFLRYKFNIKDFHVDLFSGHDQTTHLQIVLQWREITPNSYKKAKYRDLCDYWCPHEDGHHRLYYCIHAYRDEHKITSERCFLNNNGDIIDPIPSNELIREFIDFHPVIRLRDARRLREKGIEPSIEGSREVRNIASTVRRLETRPGRVNEGELKSSLNMMGELMNHHFAFQTQKRTRGIIPSHLNSNDEIMESINKIRHLVTQNETRQTGILLMSLLNSYIQTKGQYQLKPYARPLWIIEEPEARLHPTLLNQVWGLLQDLPMQKVLTTNSSDLLSNTPLPAIRRLIRRSDLTHVYQIGKYALSHDEFRRVGFHIHFHRPTAFFARSWLLVEGETEIWLFTEFARLLGYNLAAEGIQMIEFAQSGLKPMIKIAKSLEIEWYVITDGDQAGKKYLETATHFVEQGNPKQHVTKLPAKDIEHFLYDNGYENVFRELAGVSDSPNITQNKIISKAVHRHAKPDVALAMVRYCEKKGLDLIPDLLREIIKRLVINARSTM